MTAVSEATIPVQDALDTLPMAAFHWRLLAIIGATILLDGFDIQLAAFAAPAMLAEWKQGAGALAPAMAAGLIGMAIGTGLGGKVGDRAGRRLALLASVVWFGAAALLTAFAADLTQFAVLRFVTGIGLGAAVPNATALAAEWMPARVRNYAVTGIIVAVPCGGMIGAALASWLIPAFGWRFCFAVGGLLPVILGLVMWRSLPESPTFLARKPGEDRAVEALLRRAGAVFPAGARYLAPPGIAGEGRVYSGVLLRSAVGLAIAFFAGMLALYAYVSWIPVLLSGIGFPMDRAIQGSMLFNLCGVAAAFAAAWTGPRLGSRINLVAACGLALLATLACAWLISTPGASQAQVLAGIGAAGAGAFAVQCLLYSLAAHVFPVECRAAGIGYSASIGRLGAILSAFGAGFVLSLPSGQTAYFTLIAVAVVVAAGGVLLVDRHAPGRAREA